MDNKKFIAEMKDVRLTVKRADTFGVSFVNCEQDILRVEEAQNVIRLIQTKKVSASNWLRWFTQGMPEIVVSLPHDVEVCEVESDSNQVLITDIEIGKLYVEVNNGKVEVVNLKADDVFLKCYNGLASATNVEVTHVCTLDTLNGMSILEGTITKDAILEVDCENGVTEVSDKKKVNCKNDGFAHYMVHCLNGKAIAK